MGRSFGAENLYKILTYSPPFPSYVFKSVSLYYCERRFLQNGNNLSEHNMSTYFPTCSEKKICPSHNCNRRFKSVPFRTLLGSCDGDLSGLLPLLLPEYVSRASTICTFLNYCNSTESLQTITETKNDLHKVYLHLSNTGIHEF
jgi:hypothetical protein